VIGFALASAFAWAAPSGNWLIAARAVQGASAAAMAPLSLVIVVDAAPLASAAGHPSLQPILEVRVAGATSHIRRGSHTR
jgi:MFS family permease